MYLSGNFAELRPNHFHTGIDIKTKGQIGEAIYSIDDGYLARVYVSPYGYGRALYIQHPNGYTSVYGHLDSFSPKIDKLVKSIQYKQQQFTIDHHLKAGEITLKKGELIAQSGNSGSSGGPHLHFEIRHTASEKPVNPLLFGFNIKDEMRPQLTGIKLFNINGAINNSSDERYYPTVFYGDEFHLKANPSIRAWGEIGIGIQAYDYLSGDWSKCGIREAELYVDGKSYAIFQADTLSFSELKFINASTDYEEKMRHGKWILKLFKDKPNNHLSNIRPFINRGILNINKERDYDIKIIVRDTYNNQSNLNFTIKGQEQTIQQQAFNREAIPFYWDQNNVFAQGDFRIEIKDMVLYNNVSFVFSENKSDFFLSNIYTFGDTYTPLHNYASINIKPNKTVSDPEKLYVLRVTDKGSKIEALNSSYEDGWVKTSTRYLGNFALLCDTIQPVIKSLQTMDGRNIKHLKSIRFKISDNESGVKRYKGFIDDKWALFEFDGKNNLLTYRFDKERVSSNQHHNLRLELVDNCGNMNIFDAKFYW